METMKAVIYEDVGKFSVKQVPVPKVEKGTDLLLRVDACSICGTDVHILSTPPGVDAKKGIVLGHEMVGTIIDKGSDVKGYNIGDRVVIDNNVPCGHCEECQTGHYNTCLNMNGRVLMMMVYLHNTVYSQQAVPQKYLNHYLMI